MEFSKGLFRAVAFLLALVSFVAAGPGGYVALINSTPYDWKLVHSHDYQMDWKFPTIIPAGISHLQYIEFYKDHHDDAAEAVYSLLGASAPMSFTVQARHRGHKRIEIQYHDNIESLNNPIESNIDLGFVHDGAVSFVLSGSGNITPFISSNPPTGWMQATLPFIHKRSLREIVMLASHNAGMSKLTIPLGGVEHNTRTQTVGVYQQAEYGARHFDLRPAYRSGKFWTGHFSQAKGSLYVGGMGVSFENVISDINRFTKTFPGELIILDISHDLNVEDIFHCRPLTIAEWHKLYGLLDSIDNLWVPHPGPLPDDLSKVAVSNFISPSSKSAVIVRLPNSAPSPFSIHGAVARNIQVLDKNSAPRSTVTSSRKDRAPSALPIILHGTAFIHESRMPISGSYSDTDKPSFLIDDQIQKMRESRPSPKYPMLMSVWTITQHLASATNVGVRSKSIIESQTAAHHALFKSLWNKISKEVYPNLIQVDNLYNKQILALVIALNNKVENF